MSLRSRKVSAFEAVNRHCLTRYSEYLGKPFDMQRGFSFFRNEIAEYDSAPQPDMENGGVLASVGGEFRAPQAIRGNGFRTVSAVWQFQKIRFS